MSLFGDIVIGGVKAIADKFERKKRVVWHAYPTVCNKQNGHAVAHGNLINFIFDRAGVSIHEDLYLLRLGVGHFGFASFARV